MNIDILSMGISSRQINKFVYNLKDMKRLPVFFKSYNLFRLSDIIEARTRVKQKRADAVIFYWDINDIKKEYKTLTPNRFGKIRKFVFLDHHFDLQQSEV
ncbi:MAG: hypothetical protein PVJ19_09690 [Desulfobacteraceae bacterium]|jgi:hypothetical protein